MDARHSIAPHTNAGRRGNAVITFLLLVGFLALASAALFPSAKANVSTLVSQLNSLLF